MRIACLQFSPQLGKVTQNISRADQLLQGYSAGAFDILVLPEMAFSGYSFASLEAILPYLEPSCAGPTMEWARRTAARLRCAVTVGYPEIASAPTIAHSLTTPTPIPPAASPSSSPRYNSTITISSDGEILAHYRKTHLYYTDETWAQESPTGFLTIPLPLPLSSHPHPQSSPPSQKTKTTFGICMDLNPLQFTAPWDLYEFATHALSSSTQLLLISMAWLTHMPASAAAWEPDMDTFKYWCERLRPLVEQRGREVVVVVANRCGEEGVEREGVRFAGTSWVGRVGGGMGGGVKVSGTGEVGVWGMLGRGEERVLVVDTENEEEIRWRFRFEEREREGEV